MYAPPRFLKTPSLLYYIFMPSVKRNRPIWSIFLQQKSCQHGRLPIQQDPCQYASRQYSRSHAKIGEMFISKTHAKIGEASHSKTHAKNRQVY